MSPFHACLLATALLAISGCHDGLRFQIGGRVTLDEQPLGHATLEFIPDPSIPGTVPLRAETDADGNYEVCGEFRQPETAIRYTVRITTGGETLNESGESVVVAEHVPARYNEHTNLTTEVTAGRNRHDFQLAIEDKSQSRQE
jgi:hypothetical protein